MSTIGQSCTERGSLRKSGVDAKRSSFTRPNCTMLVIGKRPFSKGVREHGTHRMPKNGAVWHFQPSRRWLRNYSAYGEPSHRTYQESRGHKENGYLIPSLFIQDVATRLVRQYHGDLASTLKLVLVPREQAQRKGPRQ